MCPRHRNYVLTGRVPAVKRHAVVRLTLYVKHTNINSTNVVRLGVKVETLDLPPLRGLPEPKSDCFFALPVCPLYTCKENEGKDEQWKTSWDLTYRPKINLSKTKLPFIPVSQT